MKISNGEFYPNYGIQLMYMYVIYAYDFDVVDNFYVSICIYICICTYVGTEGKKLYRGQLLNKNIKAVKQMCYSSLHSAVATYALWKYSM